jgi:hypothetical protein
MLSVKHILTAVVVLAAASGVRADMVPLSERDMGSHKVGGIVVDCPLQPVQIDPVPFSCLVFADLDGLPVGPFADAQAGAEPADASQPTCVLEDKQDSLGLCLYAFLSLGLCKAVSWVKFLSACVVLGWCHDGGPFQAGHDHTIFSDCLCIAAAHGVVPPDAAIEGPLPQYRCEAVFSLWRKQQSVPTVLASRAPPARPCSQGFLSLTE